LALEVAENEVLMEDRHVDKWIKQGQKRMERKFGGEDEKVGGKTKEKVRKKFILHFLPS
jgi:ribosomal protein L44E